MPLEAMRFPNARTSSRKEARSRMSIVATRHWQHASATPSVATQQRFSTSSTSEHAAITWPLQWQGGITFEIHLAVTISGGISTDQEEDGCNEDVVIFLEMGSKPTHIMRLLVG